MDTGKKLAKLFDFQKYENEPGLGAVINETISKYSRRISALSDDELDMAAGGVGSNDDSDDIQANGRCPNCAGLLEKTSFGYRCRGCGNLYDRNKNLIGQDAGQAAGGSRAGSVFRPVR